MSLEQEIFEQRCQKLKAIQALGQPAYPHEFAFSHTLPEVVEKWTKAETPDLEAQKPEVKVCGRILSLRPHGKTAFVDLHQGGARLQAYVKMQEVGEKTWELLNLLDLGDLAGIEGYLFRTRMGELTVHVRSLRLLSKALLPMPEKWHGLQDIETRYRQRYVDLIANHEVRKIFEIRAKVMSTLRRELESRGFIEVETPMMQPLAGGATARPFRTHHNALDMPLYLRIALELYLKRLTVGGLDRVYEINRVFRNEGISSMHNPEFTMLEFYQAYANYHDLMDLTEQMIPAVAQAATGSLKVQYGELEIDFSRFRRLTMRQALVEFWPDDAGRPTLEQLRKPGCTAQLVKDYNAWASGEGAQPPIHPPEGTPEGAVIAMLFEAVSERHLVQPTIIYEYPVATSPLAKKKEDEPDWVERFEVYAAGMEICNAYSELNDPLEQYRRFADQLKARERGDQEAHVMDEDYVRALCYGMPPTAGYGLGVDRLTMLLTNSRSIREVILFPLLRPEGPVDIMPAVRAAAEK